MSAFWSQVMPHMISTPCNRLVTVKSAFNVEPVVTVRTSTTLPLDNTFVLPPSSQKVLCDSTLSPHFLTATGEIKLLVASLLISKQISWPKTWASTTNKMPSSLYWGFLGWPWFDTAHSYVYYYMDTALPSLDPMFAFFSPSDFQPCKTLVLTPLQDLVPPLEGLIRVASRLVTYSRCLTRSRVLRSLPRLSNLLRIYTRVAFGLPLGGCMDIPSVVASANIFLSCTRVKTSKSTVMIEPCLLTCLTLSLYGGYFSIDLHTAAGQWISRQLTSVAPFWPDMQPNARESVFCLCFCLCMSLELQVFIFCVFNWNDWCSLSDRLSKVSLCWVFSVFIFFSFVWCVFTIDWVNYNSSAIF